MRHVDLRELEDMLGQMPVMAEMNPLSLAFLPQDVQWLESAWDLAATLDSPVLQLPKPVIATQIEPALQHRLPAVRCTHNPLTTKLNQVLLKRYSLIELVLLRQSEVAREIVRQTDAEAIAVVLVDGLGWADLIDSRMPYRGQEGHAMASVDGTAESACHKVRPVLVDGVSVTEQGMIRIVGEPPLSQRLFDAGFHACLGFSYWDRAEEPLTDRLFAGFGKRLQKVRSFDDALSALERANLKGAFIQIVRMGLDAVSHRQRERPNVGAVVRDVLTGFEQLVELFERRGIPAWVHLTSDHGVLWAHQHNFQAYEFGGADHPRYYEHARRSDHALSVEFEGKEFALLEYPYLRRQLRANEWGVHGGLSFEESVVPWLSYRVSGRKEV